MAPAETLDRRSVARVGSITIARHGKPDADRGVKLTWRQYEDWWSAYDRTGLEAGQSPPERLLQHAREADVIFASTIPRAICTAEAVAAGKPIVTDAVFVEAPLPPPPIVGRRTPRTWGVFARIAWWFGRAAGGESRQEAELRAEAAAATLTARALRGENVLLCAHGWFNRMMRPVLLSQGWRCVEDGGDTYWSFRRYEKRQ
ncbi:MAG: histidine phosphatase family protein [Hyphomonadaceae bacterium]